MTESLPTEVSILADVNVLAIGLTDDHPAHDDVFPWMQTHSMGPTSCFCSIIIRYAHSI